MAESSYVENGPSETQEAAWWSGFKVGVIGGVFVTVAASLLATAMIRKIEIPNTAPEIEVPCPAIPSHPAISPDGKQWECKGTSPG